VHHPDGESRRLERLGSGSKPLPCDSEPRLAGRLCRETYAVGGGTAMIEDRRLEDEMLSQYVVRGDRVVELEEYASIAYG